MNMAGKQGGNERRIGRILWAWRSGIPYITIMDKHKFLLFRPLICVAKKLNSAKKFSSLFNLIYFILYREYKRTIEFPKRYSTQLIFNSCSTSLRIIPLIKISGV